MPGKSSALTRQTTERVGVVIVGYNSRQYLESCLESLVASTYKNIKVYFIDNNSQDDSAKLVRQKFPAVNVVSLKKNLGFAGANNFGAELAIQDSCTYLFLLNPDTEIDSRCLETLVRQANPSTILQPLLLLYRRKRTFLLNTSGNALHYLGLSFIRDYKKDYRRQSLPDKLAVASGAAMFIPAAVINELGLFDERFFMYHEDVDFSWRARLSGIEIRQVQTAKVWHKYQFSRNPRKYYFIERNRWMFVLRNYQLRTLILFMPMFLISELGLVIYSLVSGFFKEKITAMLHASQELGNARRFYKNGASKRVLSDKDLYRYFYDKVSFFDNHSRAIELFSQLSAAYWKLIRLI